MPSRHIPEDAWKLIEGEVVKATIETKREIKAKDVIRFAIKKGLKDIDSKDYWKLVKKE
ncbi:MAG: hypothetical protein GY941_08745 [Planctomycetes bacterium]|nr:hypothetical protein [Planctomycetota bacterium]